MNSKILDLSQWKVDTITATLDRYYHPDYDNIVIHRMIKHQATPPYIRDRFIIWIAGVSFHYSDSLQEMIQIAYCVATLNIYTEIRTGSIRSLHTINRLMKTKES
jgi:hypothetical protein